MVKRMYFYNIRWNHLDGKQSYSFTSGTVTFCSLFSDPNYVLEESKKELDDARAEFKGGMIEVMAFNRI